MDVTQKREGIFHEFVIDRPSPFYRVLYIGVVTFSSSDREYCIIMGVDEEGSRKVIYSSDYPLGKKQRYRPADTVARQRGKKTTFWEAVFTKLKDRGLDRVGFVTCQELDGLCKMVVKMLGVVPQLCLGQIGSVMKNGLSARHAVENSKQGDHAEGVKGRRGFNPIQMSERKLLAQGFNILFRKEAISDKGLRQHIRAVHKGTGVSALILKELKALQPAEEIAREYSYLKERLILKWRDFRIIMNNDIGKLQGISKYKKLRKQNFLDLKELASRQLEKRNEFERYREQLHFELVKVPAFLRSMSNISPSIATTFARYRSNPFVTVLFRYENPARTFLRNTGCLDRFQSELRKDARKDVKKKGSFPEMEWGILEYACRTKKSGPIPALLAICDPGK